MRVVTSAREAGGCCAAARSGVSISGAAALPADPLRCGDVSERKRRGEGGRGDSRAPCRGVRFYSERRAGGGATPRAETTGVGPGAIFSSSARAGNRGERLPSFRPPVFIVFLFRSIYLFPRPCPGRSLACLVPGARRQPPSAASSAFPSGWRLRHAAPGLRSFLRP
jgi:hypothetical protein